MTTEQTLEAIHDSRKSFYGKAVVMHTQTQEALVSYNTTVAFCDKHSGKMWIRENAQYWWSQTTQRHIDEFAMQHGKGKLGKKETMRLPESGELF